MPHSLQDSMLVSESSMNQLLQLLPTDLTEPTRKRDLGGGTFDVSLLNIEDGVFEVTATAGDVC